jgi:hypothetical protein
MISHRVPPPAPKKWQRLRQLGVDSDQSQYYRWVT